MTSVVDKIKIAFELSKLRISQFVTLSTATGYILAAEKISFEMLIPMLGILFMACGSAGLNQVQEHEKDALMQRTQRRPIPSGRISVPAAVLISLVLLAIGGAVLYFGTNSTAFVLAVLTVFWYNAIYTYLKRISPLAVIPGSVIGALPPLVGWASTGRTIWSSESLMLALFFFIWQIPHFWLLLLSFGEDYEKAGYPSLTTLLTRKQLGRLTFTWISITAVLLLLISLFGLGSSPIVFLLFLITSVSLVVRSLNLLKPSGQRFSPLPAFHSINLFIIIVMFLMTLDRLF